MFISNDRKSTFPESFAEKQENNNKNKQVCENIKTTDINNREIIKNS